MMHAAGGLITYVYQCAVVCRLPCKRLSVRITCKILVIAEKWQACLPKGVACHACGYSSTRPTARVALADALAAGALADALADVQCCKTMQAGEKADLSALKIEIVVANCCQHVAPVRRLNLLVSVAWQPRRSSWRCPGLMRLTCENDLHLLRPRGLSR